MSLRQGEIPLNHSLQKLEEHEALWKTDLWAILYFTGTYVGLGLVWLLVLKCTRPSQNHWHDPEGIAARQRIQFITFTSLLLLTLAARLVLPAAGGHMLEELQFGWLPSLTSGLVGILGGLLMKDPRMYRRFVALGRPFYREEYENFVPISSESVSVCVR